MPLQQHGHLPQCEDQIVAQSRDTPARLLGIALGYLMAPGKARKFRDARQDAQLAGRRSILASEGQEPAKIGQRIAQRRHLPVHHSQ